MRFLLMQGSSTTRLVPFACSLGTGKRRLQSPRLSHQDLPISPPMSVGIELSIHGLCRSMQAAAPFMSEANGKCAVGEPVLNEHGQVADDWGWIRRKRTHQLARKRTIIDLTLSDDDSDSDTPPKSQRSLDSGASGTSGGAGDTSADSDSEGARESKVNVRAKGSSSTNMHSEPNKLSFTSLPPPAKRSKVADRHGTEREVDVKTKQSQSCSGKDSDRDDESSIDSDSASDTDADSGGGGSSSDTDTSTNARAWPRRWCGPPAVDYAHKPARVGSAFQAVLPDLVDAKDKKAILARAEANAERLGMRKVDVDELLLAHPKAAASSNGLVPPPRRSERARKPSTTSESASAL